MPMSPPRPAASRCLLLLVALLSLTFAAHAQSDSLTTLFARNNSTSAGGAVYFNLTVQSPLSIAGFDINSDSLAGVVGSLDVHVKPGTHVGFEQTPGAWTLVGSAPITAIGVDLPTAATLAVPIVLAPGSYGMTLHYVGLAPAYTNGTGSNQIYADSNLVLTAGSSQVAFLSSIPFQPRVANVTIYYTPAPLPPAPVVINEFAYDDTGTDDREFVELYNRSGAPFDIGGWQLRTVVGGSSVILATIPGATILPAGGFWLVAQPFWSARNQALAAAIPDVATAISLHDAGGTRIDSVAYEEFAGLPPTAPREGNALFPDFLSTDGFETAWARLRDGHDADRNADDFRIARATPGASNNQPLLSIWTETCDALAPGAAVPGWYGSRGAPVVVAANTVTVGAGTLPPSPQAPAPNDRCIQFAAGPTQGASYWLESDFEHSAGFDGYVYLDATPLLAPARQAWSIGIRGGTGSEFAWPEPPGNALDDNGDRGLSWTYLRDAGGSTLYLLDHGDGGRDEQLIAEIPITASGWQRLSIEADTERTEARFGGTVGLPNGALIRHHVGLAAGNLFVGVRNESVVAALMIDNVGWRLPPILQLTGGGSGCQGNCYFVNGEVSSIAETSKVPAGVYAFLFLPSGPVSFNHVCFFTADPQASGITASITLHEPDNPSLPSRPAALITGTSAGLLQDQSGSTEKASWWAAQTGLTGRTTPFYVVLTTGAGIKAPLAAQKFDAQGTTVVFDPIKIAYLRQVGGAWTHPGQKQPWAIAFVCPDKSGYLTAKTVIGDLVPGNSFSFEVFGGASSQPLVALLGFTQIPPVDLGFLGAPGCPLHETPDMMALMLADPMGHGSWPFSIPASPVFTGLVVHVQWGGFDLSLNALGLAISGPIHAMIQ